MITAILLVASIVIAVVVYSLCKVAGESDRAEENWIAQRKKEENFKWCTDECLHCDENDWCKFSEVK